MSGSNSIGKKLNLNLALDQKTSGGFIQLKSFYDFNYDLCIACLSHTEDDWLKYFSWDQFWFNKAIITCWKTRQTLRPFSFVMDAK